MTKADIIFNKYATGDLAGKVGTGLLVGLGLIVSTRLADIIVDKLRAWGEQRKSSKYYKQMLEAHPKLMEEDPELVARYWASLRKHAPSLSEDPLAAGAFITQALKRTSHFEFGGPPPETFLTLSEIERRKKDVDTRHRLSDYTDKVYLESFTKSLLE